IEMKCVARQWRLRPGIVPLGVVRARARSCRRRLKVLSHEFGELPLKFLGIRRGTAEIGLHGLVDQCLGWTAPAYRARASHLLTKRERDERAVKCEMKMASSHPSPLPSPR